MAEKLKVFNPYDNSVIAELDQDSESSVAAKLSLTQSGLVKMRDITQQRRAEILNKAADIVKERSEEFARTLVLEVGKTWREASGEAARCVNTLRLSAIEAMKLAGEEVPFSSANHPNKQGFYRRVPCGVVAAITPFNFPLNLVAHKLGPALAAGCSALLKPASVTPLSGIKLVEALHEAGVPKEALQVVIGPGSTVGNALVTSPVPRMVTFTGSKAVGEEITRHVGLKKIALELGSNSAVVILEDGDLERAAKRIRIGGYSLAGQVCISTQRVYVEEEVYQPFLDLLVSQVSTLKTGNPLDEATELGPMIEGKQIERILSWIDEAKSRGAEVVLEGKRESSLLGPWILTHVPEDAKLIKMEAFAPLVVVNPVRDLEDAIERVNATCYGLQGAVFTRDLKKAFRACDGIDAGGVLVNEIPTFRVDLMPYGGMKGSGLGREGPAYAVREMTEGKLYLFDLS
ncbi:aldehyde dehydrogenase [candidate division TA06 bacterium B3_TA06]|uniref:Aldehyde dehydrogenase n=1 Tax=candidate division TA06 bacterium B3_TA06 TaxID=2012487 RepID=A0A532V0P9_UNCT6|nr:MAG: aldehyde dehydrogenase [candidate division TA06 bacterium B3_TA06]